ncbi:MAG: RidA family protein [Elusimicrobia bacterium]|nr:RidA family protein [Elusimicrobiota bacterium]
MMKKVISTEKAPKAVGPYSQAIETDNLIFVSGQLPINPRTGEMAKTVEEQTKQAIENISSILELVGLSLDNVVKTTVFMTDLTKFSNMNEVYAQYFKTNPPARAAFEVKALPKNADVEIEAVATKK